MASIPASQRSFRPASAQEAVMEFRASVNDVLCRQAQCVPGRNEVVENVSPEIGRVVRIDGGHQAGVQHA